MSLAAGLSTEDRALLIFRAGAAWFAVDAKATTEVAELGEPTPLPGMPSYVPGLVVLSGRAVPLLDLAKFLNLAPAAPSSGAVPEEDDSVGQRVLVVTSGGMEVGIISPRVRGVFEVPASDLAPPEALGEGVRPFTRAQVDLDLGLVAVLDLESLLRSAKPGDGAGR